jgi:RNA polymerase sigma-70 factor (ECF subfamily)
LYDLIHKKVYFYLFRLLKDKESAEDVMVETFTEVWKCADKYKGMSQARTWVFGIARNLAMNAMRKDKVHDDIDDYPQLSDNRALNSEVIREASDRRRVIMSALARISSKHREVLDLVFFHEMKYQEISKVLDIPLTTVKTRVFYAKDALKIKLSDMGVDRDAI